MERIINNEDKKLSRNRKRRIERKSKMDNNIKLLLNKKNREEKEKKKLDKIKHLEILLANNKYANDHKKLENALKELNKIRVVNKNLHEIIHEILIDYEGKFDMVGNLKIGDQNRETRIRFRNINDYEAYNNTIDQDYDSKVLFSMIIFINSTFHSLIESIDLNMEMVVVLIK